MRKKYQQMKIVKAFIFLALISLGLLMSQSAFAGTATLSWGANTESDLAGYKIYYGTSPRTGTDPKTCSLCGYSSSVNVGNVLTYAFSSLTDGLTYYFSISSYDTSNNESSFSAEVSKAIPAIADTTAPTVPTSLTATAFSSSQINLSWTASTDAVGVTGYKIYRGGTQITTTTGTSYSNTGLTSSTAYSYTVSAYDAAGNSSAQTASVSATTQTASAVSSAWVQDNSNSSTSATTINTTLVSNVTSGNLIIVSILYSTASTPTISDNQGNTYTLNKSQSITAAGRTTGVYSAIASSTGSLTVTLSVTGSAQRLGLIVTEFSGIDTTTNRVDQTTSATGSGTVVSSGNVTTTVANDLFYGSVYDEVASIGAVLGAGYSNLEQNTTGRIASETKVVSGIVTDDADFTVASGNWAAILVAYKPSTGSTGGGGTTDTTAPTRSAGSPTGSLSSGTTSATLSITTDENSTCKYGTTANTVYSSIANTFTTTGGTTHTRTISGLTSGSSYSYYVRCQDTAGNANTTDYPISFSVASASASDTTAPTTTASFTGGTYNGSQTVSLSVNETATTYYTIDGSTPTTASSVYSTSLSISQTTTLKYFSRDTAGNSETVKTQTYTISVSTAFSSNDRVQTTSNTNVRQTSSILGALTGTENTGNIGTVISGPIYADSYWWWQIQYDSGLTGWSVEDYLVKYQTSSTGGGSTTGGSSGGGSSGGGGSSSSTGGGSSSSGGTTSSTASGSSGGGGGGGMTTNTSSSSTVTSSSSSNTTQSTTSSTTSASTGSTTSSVVSGGSSASSSGSSSVGLPALTGPFSIGMTSEQVNVLQEYLSQDTSIYPDAIISGYYGSLTQKAVEKFQQKYGIITSGTPSTTGFGLAGPGTRAKLSELYGSASTSASASGSATSAQSGASSADQEALKVLLQQQINELQKLLEQLLAELVIALQAQLQGISQ